MNIRDLHWIEWIIATVVLLIIAAMIVAFSRSSLPDDYKYNPYTETATWTDEEGRKMIRSSDGSVRELSPRSPPQ